MAFLCSSGFYGVFLFSRKKIVRPDLKYSNFPSKANSNKIDRTVYHAIFGYLVCICLITSEMFRGLSAVATML